jgi:hypothetical protein
MKAAAKQSSELVAERFDAGKSLRNQVSRKAHGQWQPPAERRDDFGNPGRIEQGTACRSSLPFRYGRMLRSPFTFLRGSAGLMAYDLASMPTTGLRCRPAVTVTS